MLEVRHLEIRYGDVPAVHDVSCEVKENEIVSIVGSNGAGKSTLLKALAGLLQPFRGSVVFNGNDIGKLSTDRIIRLGITYVPEDRRIFGPLTVEDNLLLGAYTVDDKVLIRKTLKDVYRMFPRLEERRKQRAGTMSGGEQQMLAIGRGLMSQPKLLMLDEPSIGIMPKLVTEIMEAIRDLKDQGYTILLVEQKIQESLEIADRGYILQTGRTVAEGTSEELLGLDLVRSAYLGL